MIPELFKDTYVVICVVFVTVMIAFCLGAFVLGFTQGLVKAIRQQRQSRQARRYLQDVMGNLHTTQADRYDGVYWIGPRRSTDYTTHFTLTEDGELINNFPEGVPPVDNRGS